MARRLSPQIWSDWEPVTISETSPLISDVERASRPNHTLDIITFFPNDEKSEVGFRLINYFLSRC